MNLFSRGPTKPAVGILELAANGDGPVHFMGIGGDGMRPLAEFLARKGHHVTGCDLEDGPALASLREQGIDARVGHDPAHINGACALVVTSAVPASHKEIGRASRRGIPVFKRAQALGSIANPGRLIAISGTHGKTTTTALAAHVMTELGFDPTAFVGGTVSSWSGNLRVGKSDIFVVEADEYDRSFLELTPDVAIITNVEADHLDIYGSERGVRRGFSAFLGGLKQGGYVIACADDGGASSLLPGVSGKSVTYGLAPGSMVRAIEVTSGPLGSSCIVMDRGREVGRLASHQTGLHNIRNSLAAAVGARTFGASWEDIFEALATFRGVRRRFEIVGEAAGAIVVDDYAHHPSEISATLVAARARFPGRRLVVAFQPHLYSRTRDFALTFGTALARADSVRISGIYPAREPPIPGVTGNLVATAAETAGHTDVRFVETLDDLAGHLAEELGPGDLLLTLGAGSIETLARDVIGRVARRAGPASLSVLGDAHA